MVTDVVSGDPLFAVSISPKPGSSLEPPLALCYQVHGDRDARYNLLSTTRTSVNGLWRAATDSLNLLAEVGVRTVSESGECHRVLVGLDDCKVTVDGEDFTSDGLLLNTSNGGVLVRRDDDRVVVIRVPGGDGEGLTLEVECEMRKVFDGIEEVEIPMLLLKIHRRSNPISGIAHGLIGLFVSLIYMCFYNYSMTYIILHSPHFNVWKVKVNDNPKCFCIGQFYHRVLGIEPYSGLDSGHNYRVTVPGRGEEPEREFHGWLYPLDWVKRKIPCLYVGNSQGGSSEEDGGEYPVIAGSYQDYAVNGTFSEEGYQFGLFGGEDCAIE